MDPIFIAMLGSVLTALIGMIGSVLLTWIRARYQVHEIPNGKPGNPPSNVQPPH